MTADRFELARRPIVVGTDGSVDSDLAVAWAGELAQSLGVELIVVHSLPLMEKLPTGVRVPSEEVREEVRALLESEWVEPASDSDVAVRTVLEDGPPLLVLPRIAERERAAMIVVGTRGKGNSPTDTIGSTCHGLLGTSPVPVVTLRS